MRTLNATLGYLFLLVRDFPGMLSFYRDTLGFPTVAWQENEFAFLRLGSDSSPQLGLYPGRGDGGAENPHWFLVIDVDDLDRAVALLGERGVAVGPIEPVPYGRAAFLSDPEGNRIELHQPDGERS
jgi:predicted enzyme related to lactoylglutathione lyase